MKISSVLVLFLSVVAKISSVLANISSVLVIFSSVLAENYVYCNSCQNIPRQKKHTHTRKIPPVDFKQGLTPLCITDDLMYPTLS